MDRDIAYWQQGIYQGSGQQELGPVAQLFQATVATFSTTLKIIADDPGRYTDGLIFYNDLKDEFQKFYMWNEGFPSSSGELDVVLSCSKNLRAIVLDLIVHWARVVCRIPRVLTDFDWSGAQEQFAELEVLADKIGQLADATVKDVNAQYAIRNTTDDSDADVYSDSSSSFSVDNFEDIIEDLKVYSECLIDLTPSLEAPASEVSAVEQSTITIEDDLLNVAEPARPFVLIIKDRFPSTDAALVRKLGQANWQRRERLSRKLAYCQRISTVSSSSSDTSSVDETIVGDVPRRATTDLPSRASVIRSSMSFDSNYQSITTTSNFSEPSIFDHHSMHVRMTQERRSMAESFTSFATSIGDGGDNGRRQLPKLPSNHDFNAHFKCTICGDMQRRISNRADWKKHVYDDLEPYICLFTDCTLGLETFQSQREWMIHEFTFHRTESNWRCHLCADIFQTEQLFRAHMSKSHKLNLTSLQISEVSTASKQLEMRDGSNEVCPFCLVIPARTQRAFARHVGRHLQELSLAALPITDTSPGSYSDDDNDNDDDDEKDDNSEEQKSEQSDRSHETVNNYGPSWGPPGKEINTTKYPSTKLVFLDNVIEDGHKYMPRDSRTVEDEPESGLSYDKDIGNISRDSIDLIPSNYQITNHSNIKNSSGGGLDMLALDYESDIVYDTTIQYPMIKGGTLLALVEQLTRHDKLDPVFNSTFLLTYQSFTTARELFQLLVKRFQMQPKGFAGAEMFEIWQEKKQKPIQFRVVNVLKTWLDNFWMEDQSDATTKLLTDMNTFIVDTVGTTNIPGFRPLMLVLEQKLQGKEGIAKKLMLIPNRPIPPPIIPTNTKRLRLLDLDVIEYARQLTILESSLYVKVKPSECLNKCWERKSRDGESDPASNVKALILHSNRLTYWVADTILHQSDVRNRASVIKHFVSIAYECWQLNNYSSLMSIISAFGTAAIHRLKRTWNILSPRTAVVLEQMRRLMGNTKNFAEYRESLSLANPPCIPFFGVYLVDLANIEDRMPSIIEKSGLINFTKQSLVARVIRDIQQYQNIPYHLHSVPEVQEYILNNMQAGTDVDELYDKSIMVEPREREDEKISRYVNQII